MIHLWKKGKRRCYICKKTYILSQIWFPIDKNGRGKGFKYECKKCVKRKIILIKLRFKTNGYSRERVKRKIFIKLGNKCRQCEIKSDLVGFFDLDHIKTRSSLGISKGQIKLRLNEIANLQMLCPNCHRIKTIKDREREKWHFKRRRAIG